MTPHEGERTIVGRKAIPTVEYDLVVVGAGPGGSNAAAAALAGGLEVAQVDRARFPRIKPCAGGLTIKACESLALPLEPSLRSTFRAFEFNAWRGTERRFGYRSPILKMVLRPEFDNHLVERNRTSDRFRFFDGEPVVAIDRDSDRFVVRTPERELVARQLVGADGANGTTNRLFRIASPRRRAVAVEINLYRDRARIEPEPVPCFDFGFLPLGYGWIFPKDDHWSVGLYALSASGVDLRARLAEYVEARGFDVDGDPLDTFEAHTIPLGGHRLAVPDEPVYVVGDAGGFADALTGEGIFHALESGRLAGETAIRVARGEAKPRAYYRSLWRRVLPDTFLTHHLADRFYRDPARSLAWLAKPVLWRPIVHGYGRGATVVESLVRGPLYWATSLMRRTTSIVARTRPTRSA